MGRPRTDQISQRANVNTGYIMIKDRPRIERYTPHTFSSLLIVPLPSHAVQDYAGQADSLAVRAPVGGSHVWVVPTL